MNSRCVQLTDFPPMSGKTKGWQKRIIWPHGIHRGGSEISHLKVHLNGAQRLGTATHTTQKYTPDKGSGRAEAPAELHTVRFNPLWV